MLKCNVSRAKNVIRVKAKGTAKELLPETVMVIKTIYDGIREASPEAAEAYKNTLIGVLLDPESPVWTGKEKDHG